MAQVITGNIKLKLNAPKALTAGVDITSAVDGCAVDYSKSDDGKVLIMLENTSAAEVTCKVIKGNALQGTGDLEVKVAAGTTQLLVVESGRFVNAYGADKGKLIINGATAVKVSAIELP